MNGYQEIAACLALVHLCKTHHIFIYMRPALPETKHKPFTEGAKIILEKKSLGKIEMLFLTYKHYL